MKPWRGHVRAAAVWLDPTWGGPPHTRLLAVWRPGSTIWRIEEGLVVRWPTPRRVDVATLPGLPLVERDGGLVGADTSGTPNVLSLPQRGRLAVFSTDKLPVVDLAELLDLGPLHVESVESLGSPPPALAGPPVPAIRARLGVGDATAEAEAARTALAAPGGPGVLSTVARMLLGWLAGLAKQQEGAAASAPASPAAMPPAGPPGPAWWERMAWRIAGPLLGAVLGTRFARWFDELVELFESDRFEDALRRAIPLGGEGGGDKFPSFGLPAPRTKLEFGAPGGNGRGVSLVDGLYARLKQEYERAARRLEAEGRIDEAAFVLIELLRDVDRGLKLLETHEKFVAAAEIVEVRGMDAARAVRLWMLADRPDEAVRVSRLRGAFADAIRLLGTDTERTRGLRKAWARMLRGSGDLAGAFAVLEADEGLRAEARTMATEAVAVDAGLFPEVWHLLLPTLSTEEALRRLHPHVTGEDVEAPHQRARAATRLVQSADPRARQLGAPLLRALLLDTARGRSPLPDARLRALAGPLGGAAIQADLPARLAQDAATVLTVALRRGPLPAPVDAIPVLGTGLLVAWGEAGVRLCDARGRVKARFDLPATHLIRDPLGEAALVVGAREGFVVVHRLDLRARTVTAQFDAPLRAWAGDFDGGTWFVHDGTALTALDLLGPTPRALWRVDRLDLGDLRLHPEHFTLTTATERFAWRRKDLRLLAREPCPTPEVGIPGDPSGWVRVTATETTRMLSTSLPDSAVRLAVVPTALQDAETVDPACGATILRGRGTPLAVISPDRSVHVTSDAPTLARVVGDRLALTCGNHVTLVDLRAGRILAELRLGGD